MTDWLADPVHVWITPFIYNILTFAKCARRKLSDSSACTTVWLISISVDFQPDEQLRWEPTRHAFDCPTRRTSALRFPWPGTQLPGVQVSILRPAAEAKRNTSFTFHILYYYNNRGHIFRTPGSIWLPRVVSKHQPDRKSSSLTPALKFAGNGS